MHPIPYLTFHGDCRDAMEWYADVFGGEIDMMMTAGEMPDLDVPSQKSDWIAHSGLKIGDGMLMASDDIMGGTGRMDGCSVMMALATNEAGKAAFDRLAEGGSVRMDYQPTFWSAGFGTLTDRYGVHWMITTDEPPGAE